MRTRLYIALIDRLKELTDVQGKPIFRHFDLWNRQVEFLEDERPFALPAIFIEFPHIDWGAPMQGVKRATLPIALHIVSEYRGDTNDGSLYQTDALHRLALLDEVAEHLYNWRLSGDNVTIQQTHHTGSDTNHDHGEIIEDIEQFACTVISKA